MALVLSSDARMVRDTAMDFFPSKSPVTEFRKLRDSNDPDGFSRKLWQEMADLGWTGFLVSEDHGGTGFGMTGLAQVLEASGRTLAATPLIATALIGASALELAGSADQKADYLPGLVAGEALFALALEEGPHHAPNRIATTATGAGSGYVINGRKVFVLDGHVADTLIVAARTAGSRNDRAGITLFLVHSRNAASISFENVAVGANAVLGPVDGGADVLEAVLDRARAGLAAEMLGSASEAFDRTLQYLKDRRQFGVAIGSFQALKHRAAQMFCEIETTRSSVLAASAAIDDRANDAAALGRARDQ